jgi:hypothetical protein
VLGAIAEMRELDREIPDDVEGHLSALEGSLKKGLHGDMPEKGDAEKSMSKSKSDDGESDGDSKAKSFEEAGEKTKKRMSGDDADEK